MSRMFLLHLHSLKFVVLFVALMQSRLQVPNAPSGQSVDAPVEGGWTGLVVASAAWIPSVRPDTQSLSAAQSPSQKTKNYSGNEIASLASVLMPGVFAPKQITEAKESAKTLPSVAMRKSSNASQPPRAISTDSVHRQLSRMTAPLWLPSANLPPQTSLSSRSTLLTASAPSPLLLPPSDASNIPVRFPITPSLPPSPGCCLAKTVPRPGLPSSSCICVYPIVVELLIEDVSKVVTNWSGLFEQDLASGLGLKTIQIEITSFQFENTNVSLAIIIVPLKSVSFSSEEANRLETKLNQYKVHFNRSLFGKYSLTGFQVFEPLASSPLEMAIAGPPTMPTAGNLPSANATSVARDGQKLHLWLIVVIAIAAVAISLVVPVFLWCKCRQLYRARKSLYKGESAVSQCEARGLDATSIPRSITTRIFTFDELRQATANFNPDNILGEGGFGRVYKGALEDGMMVAIKRFGGSGQGDREFVVEVEMLSRLHHRNLVKLIGYCASRDSSEHLLCYELVSNGSLEAWLHGPPGSAQPLDWETRVKIAYHSARGLAYLHEDSQPCVIHRDFKASNILLDSSFNAKVADFGLAKLAPEGPLNYVATQVMGTFGYVAPEYAMTGHLLVKSDVYSYGVVLLELLSGRKPVDMSQPSGQENLVTWARPLLRDRERLTELADSRLKYKYRKEDFVHVAAIAAACVDPEASQRPTMGEVVQSLRMVQTQSEYTSGERKYSTDVLPSSVLSRSFPSSFQNPHQFTPTTFESDGSSSVFSSGPCSGFVFENETFSRSVISSEDLHEGR